MKRALIVVDMLHEFVDGELGGPKSRGIVPACVRAVEHARKRGWPVAFAYDDHREGDPEIEIWGEHAMHGSPGQRFVEGIRPDYERGHRDAGGGHRLEEGFPKRAYSAFTNSNLAPWLHERGVEEIVLVGTATHICVAQTAIDGFQRGFKITVVSDATCAFEGVDEKPWLEHIGRLTGAWLPSSDTLPMAV